MHCALVRAPFFAKERILSSWGTGEEASATKSCVSKLVNSLPLTFARGLIKVTNKERNQPGLLATTRKRRVMEKE
jgi:hypothetical protein